MRKKIPRWEDLCKEGRGKSSEKWREVKEILKYTIFNRITDFRDLPEQAWKQSSTKI